MHAGTPPAARQDRSRLRPVGVAPSGQLPSIVRVALLTQGLLYVAAAIISTVNVGLFLRLVHRPRLASAA